MDLPDFSLSVFKLTVLCLHILLLYSPTFPSSQSLHYSIPYVVEERRKKK